MFESFGIQKQERENGKCTSKALAKNSKPQKHVACDQIDETTISKNLWTHPKVVVCNQSSQRQECNDPKPIGYKNKCIKVFKSQLEILKCNQGSSKIHSRWEVVAIRSPKNLFFFFLIFKQQSLVQFFCVQPSFQICYKQQMTSRTNKIRLKTYFYISKIKIYLQKKENEKSKITKK